VNLKTYLLLVSSALLWSTGYIAAKFVLDRLNPVSLAAVRYLVAGLLLTPALARASPRDLWSGGGGKPVLWAGLLVLPLQNILFLVGLNLTLASDASLIAAAGPAITALLARVALRERLTANKAVGISLSFAGVAILIGLPALEDGGQVRWLGDLLVLGSTASWSLYTVLSGLALRRSDPLQVTAATTLLASAVLFPLGALAWLWTGTGGLTWDTLAMAVYLALAANVLATLWWVRGVSAIGAGRASVFANLVPLATTLLSAVVLKEHLSPTLGLSALLVMGGVWLTNLKVS
jgi:drug/metabolite transporter (DMT)-like permease